MRRFFPGETLRVAIRFADDQDQPVSVSGVTLHYRRDNGPVVKLPIGAITELGAGRYRADITLTEPSIYALRATCDAPSTAATEDSIMVVPSKFG